MTTYKEMPEKLVEIANLAGKTIMGIYKNDFSIEYKSDKSPLTEADKKANSIIMHELKKSYPEIPILSEEEKEIPFSIRKNWKEFFLVDPLDGTKEFIKKNGEFTVNIAFIKENKPYFGVVYAPVLDEIFYNDENKSYKIEKNIKKQIKCRKNPSKLKVVASRSHFNEETKNFIEKYTMNYELINKGSSLKICLVAEGKADFYPRLGKTMEWDTAAAHSVLLKAEGSFTKLDGSEFIYNKENLLNPYFLAKNITYQ